MEFDTSRSQKIIELANVVVDMNMNASTQITQLNNSANELLATIENELWDEAIELSQQWDANIRSFVCGLSAEQVISMKNEIEEIASQNSSIKDRLIDSRAKVLTLIQENNNSRTAIQLYNKTA